VIEVRVFMRLRATYEWRLVVGGIAAIAVPSTV